MTSPAINNGNNGQKDATSKTASNATLAQPSSNARVGTNSPFTAWWRIFKLCNLLMQQGC